MNRLIRKVLWMSGVVMLSLYSAHATSPSGGVIKSKTMKNQNNSRVLRAAKKANPSAAVIEGCTYPVPPAATTNATATLDNGSCNFDAYVISRPAGAL